MAGSDSGDVFDIKRIRRLVELMKAHDLNEIDLRDGEQQIRLRREEQTVVTQAAPVPAVLAPAAPAPAAPAPPSRYRRPAFSGALSPHRHISHLSPECPCHIA